MDLLLRPWRADDDDARALAEAAASSPDLALQVGGADLSGVEACLRHLRATTGADSALSLAITVAGHPVGTVRVSHVDDVHQTAWVSYWVASGYRGRGLASRSVASAARWAFDSLGLFRLELGHRTNNPASCRVAAAAGFAPEGIERAKLRYGSERFDVETHARLATDPDVDLGAPVPVVVGP
ncbi:GNAT family N-acetyltransferase [Cellulomonas sp. HZM]|uniref:GNAT family N-acetyltransferase n=1 Tax=Cellulomonas sp. HZM TaxID=1454010 RepID=UPI0004934CFE|nr:GNAT family protein [Cellulomonas sp. HZM]